MVFILRFVNVVYNTDCFVDIEKSLYPWDKSHLIMVYVPFNVLLDQFAVFRWGFLHLCSLVILTCSFLFLGCLCLVLLSGYNVGLIEWAWKCFFLCNFFLNNVESYHIVQKKKIELPYDSTTPLLGIYPEKNIIQKDSSTPVFIPALSIIAKTWKHLRYPSTEEWIKRIWFIYTMKY